MTSYNDWLGTVNQRNEIDFPTMTQEKRRLLLNAENNERRVPVARMHIAWWLPIWIVFLLFCAFVFTLIQKSKSVPGHIVSPVMIDPDVTHCQSLTYLEKANWRRVPEGENERIASNPRNRIVLFQTLICKNGEQTFTLREPWYETTHLPARRVGVQ